MKRIIFFISVFLFVIAGIIYSQIAAGKIIGRVSDSEGNFLPGVTIEALSPGMVGEANTVTDANGRYRLLAIPSGNYTLRCSLPGFKTFVQEEIILEVDQTLTINIQMEIGGVEEEITVVGESPLIDVKSTSKSMNLSKEVFKSLPKGRDFESLVYIMPGVNREPAKGGLTVDGATNAENRFFSDGVDITNIFYGDKGQSSAFEFVEEVQMKASGYQAEYGGAVGGVLNVITRSGGDEYHGELIGYYSGSFLNGKERDSLRVNPFDVTKAEYVNYQDLYGKDKIDRFEGGFSLGGYILKDRLWFFSSFLPVFHQTIRHVEWIPQGVAPESDHTRNQQTYNLSVKLTSQPIKGLRLSLNFLNNFSKYRGDLPNRRGTDNPTKEWEKYGYDYPNWSAAFHADYTIGNNLLISGRAGYFVKNTTNQQVQPTEPRWYFGAPTPEGGGTTNNMFPEIPSEYVKPTYWSNYGYSDGYVTQNDMRARIFTSLNTTLYLDFVGEHAWKAGMQFVRVEHDVNNTFKYEYILLGWDRSFKDMITGEETSGKYGYYSIRNAQATEDHPYHPFGTFANPLSYRWAVFIQDSWTPPFLNERLTLNLGIRAESEDVPSYSTIPEYQKPAIEFGFKDKLSPRLGFVFDVFKDSNTKIFGSYGLYYDVMKLNLAQTMYGGFKWISDYYTLEDWNWKEIGNGNYPGTYLGSYDWRYPAFDVTDPDAKPFHQREISFGLEQRIGKDISASVRIVNKHLIRTLECVGKLVPGVGEVYYITNPGFGFNRLEKDGGLFSNSHPTPPKAKREYWAANFSLTKRLSNNWLGGISYTLSRLWGNYDGLLGWGPNVGRHWDLWYMNWDKDMNEIEGLLSIDRPHQIKVYGSYSFNFGLSLGINLTAMSGTPVSRELGTPVETMYLGRMSDGRTPFLMYSDFYAEYSLRMSSDFTLQLNLNVDNLLDTSTALNVWENYGYTSIVIPEEERLDGWDPSEYDFIEDPRFLKEYNFHPPFEARIGVKLIF
jgi:hypothetical protein